MIRTTIVAILATSATFLVAPSSAEACLHSMKRDKAAAPLKLYYAAAEANDGRLQAARANRAELDAAVDELNANRNRQAIRRLYGTYGYSINQWALNPEITSGLQREIVLVTALATLRTEGLYYRDQEADPAPKKVHPNNVKWAILAMENLAFVDFASERHMAEAWARDPELQEAALGKLRALAKAGKLESPHQYRVFARLLNKFGDTTAADDATARARELASN